MNVFLAGLGEDEHIIKIDKHELVEYISEDIVDERLEDRWSIGEVKGHNKIFIMSI